MFNDCNRRQFSLLQSTAVFIRSADGMGSRFLPQALNISLLCTASPGGCSLCRLSKKPCRRTGESTPLGGKSGSDCRGVRVCEQKSRAGGRGNRVTQRGKSGEAASSDGGVHAARQEVRQQLTGYPRQLSGESVSANRKAVSANGESVSRNGGNPGKQHQVTGKSIPLGRKSGIS